VVYQLVIHGLEVELYATVDCGVDEQVEDAQSQVSVVAGAHEGGAHRVDVSMKV